MDRETAYEITWLVRRIFRSLAARADEYLQHSDLSAADRAVMEFLYPDNRLSVPEIARRYKVSRQHVQMTVNRLLDKGLLHTEKNPRHKRSVLLRLSGPGGETFARIRRSEAVLLEQLFAGISDDELTNTRRTLRALTDNLKQESTDGIC